MGLRFAVLLAGLFVFGGCADEVSAEAKVDARLRQVLRELLAHERAQAHGTVISAR
jgi:hypothetical protein